MPKYAAQRTFNGFAVVNADGETIETHRGKGAKKRAEAHAEELNGQKELEWTGRGKRPRGSYPRGR